MPPDPLDQVVKETIRLTTWQNIRRYVTLGGIGFVILDLIITLTVVVVITAETRRTDREHSQTACRNTAKLAEIQHTTVSQQAAQTAALAKDGFTFGIPKAEFDKLVAAGAKQNAEFLAALDQLKETNCRTLE